MYDGDSYTVERNLGWCWWKDLTEFKYKVSKNGCFIGFALTRWGTRVIINRDKREVWKRDS